MIRPLNANSVQNMDNVMTNNDTLNFCEIYERIKGKAFHKWPKNITNSLDKIERLAEQWFPFNWDKIYVFLFIAFKLHPLGLLGNFLSKIVKAIVFL